ncbi:MULTISPECIES: hypothetical protein [Flavobacterium]|uniref:Outer membrane protein beta-barrel domain-containing protein n=1 Tax=Flavobacterium jumunjinense TaxID=998845 RepID=A0ABV5GN36_9FLAO|nr:MULTISPECIES: hypothetical protein [Flavobacterium]
MIKTKLVVAVCFFISSLTVFSQEIQEDVKGKDFIIKDLKSLSFYGGTIFQFTTLDNDFSFFVGGKGGVAFNRKVLLGFEGYTLKSSNTSKDNDSKELSFTYGGVFVGYVFDLGPKVQLVPTVLSAWGRIGEREVEADGDYVFFKVTDDLFVLQPELELEINVIKGFKIGLGVNYRLSTGVDSRNYVNDDISGLGGSIAFKFGKF